jgi:hypothetical protein
LRRNDSKRRITPSGIIREMTAVHTLAATMGPPARSTTAVRRYVVQYGTGAQLTL